MRVNKELGIEKKEVKQKKIVSRRKNENPMVEFFNHLTKLHSLLTGAFEKNYPYTSYEDGQNHGILMDLDEREITRRNKKFGQKAMAKDVFEVYPDVVLELNTCNPEDVQTNSIFIIKYNNINYYGANMKHNVVFVGYNGKQLCTIVFDLETFIYSPVFIETPDTLVPAETIDNVETDEEHVETDVEVVELKEETPEDMEARIMRELLE